MDVQERDDGRRIVGRRLREVREAQGRSLEELEQASKIHAHHLEALERGDYEALPSPLWARGSLLTYATHLGLDGEQLTDELLPLKRPSRLRRYLNRHWRALLAALGTIGIAATMVIATIVAPYNPFTGWVEGVLQEIAPGIFLGSEPQRIVILGFAGSGTTGGDNVLMAKVAEDGLGLLSIPRNTLTEIPDHGRGEIGDAFAMGGPDLTRRSVAGLTGTKVTHYCVIGTEGVREIVDSTDGVRIRVPHTVSGRVTPGEPEITLRPGPQALNGDQALVYLQGKDLQGDAERAKRQQGFLYAMYRQALGPMNLLANPSTLKVVLENTETDMSGIQMAQLAGRVRTLKNSDTPIKTGTVPGEEEMASSQQEGALVYHWVPDARKLSDVLEKTVR
jgi:LCP family protein required for cell wall assembly